MGILETAALSALGGMPAVDAAMRPWRAALRLALGMLIAVVLVMALDSAAGAHAPRGQGIVAGAAAPAEAR